MKEEEEKLGGFVVNKVHWRKARANGDGRFSLAELQGWLISWSRCNAHLFPFGHVTDDSFLLTILLLGSVLAIFDTECTARELPCLDCRLDFVEVSFYKLPQTQVFNFPK